MEPTGMLDQWVKYSAEDWGFLIALCTLAVWMRRSKMIHDVIANWAPVLIALTYGVAQAIETGYGFGTHLMAKGIVMAAGTIAAQTIADRILPTNKQVAL